MVDQSYGGFLPTLPAIDLRFTSIEQVGHFEAAWSQVGHIPALSGDRKSRLDLMSYGTVIEHELRHFHDYLINRDLLLASWFRRRMIMNVSPLISRILRSTRHDVVPFPLTEWASLTGQRREKLQSELQQLFQAGRNRFWSPKMLRKVRRIARSGAIPAPVNQEQFDEQERLILEAVRADRAALYALRNGPDSTPLNQLRFTPRFAFEFSALNTQLQAVFKTYGIQEGFEFVSQLAEKGTVFTRFFCDMLVFFGSGGRYEGFELEAIDFPKINLVAFWIMTGCESDGLKRSPSTRLSTLIEAARDDWNDVFPDHMEPLELLRHFEDKMGVTHYQDALNATQAELTSHTEAALQLYGSDPQAAASQLGCVKSFSAVLECRRHLVSQVAADPQRFIDPTLWMKDLNAWPQCPVHLRFGRMGINREHFLNFPPDAIFNTVTRLGEKDEKQWVGDVYLQSFFSGSAQIPLQPVVELQQQLLLVDTLIEPEQNSARDETLIREFVREHYRKELVRIL